MMKDTKLGSIYSKLKESNVMVISAPYLECKKAISFLSPESNIFWIGINEKLIKSEREELCVLMEEQAHYEVGIAPNNYESNSYSDKLTREKNEFRAKRYAVKQLIPKEQLFKLIKTSDYICIEELADAFEVTSQFMKEALTVYGLI